VPEADVAPGLCIRQSFRLFEEFAEACHGWEFDFRQLSVNASPYRLEQWSTSRMLYSRAFFGSHFHQLGGPVLGFRTFALKAENCSDFRWCGEAVHSHSLIVLPADGEFESVSLPGFDVFTLSLCNELLVRTAEVYFRRPLSAFMGSNGQVCHLAVGEVRELRALLHNLSRDVGDQAAGGASSRLNANRGQMENVLARRVLACLGRGEINEPVGPRSKRLQILIKARELIDQGERRNLSVLDLVEYTGVSRRTLEYAFHDGLGVAPAAYLKAGRLRALSRELLRQHSSATSVASLCREHGFGHAGQAAADYREMFGELPSATLSRIEGR
jgi:AraC family ethanolamine operon transcriptional activator